MADRYLLPYDGKIVDGGIGENRSVIAVMAAPPVPAFIGHVESGISWLCPGCHAEIAVNIHPRQLVDVTFICPSCMSISFTPGRQEGQPPAGRPVVMPPRMMGITSSVDLGSIPIMVISHAALDSYIKESGAHALAPGEKILQNGIVTGDFLARLADEAKQLLGERYQGLQESDRRAQASPTPPRMRHRLIELIDYAREVGKLTGTGPPSIGDELDGRQLAELMATVSLFRRWRQHPAWPRLVATLASDTENQHSVMLLAVASYLTDTGNPVGIVFRQESGRISDMWTEPVLGKRLNIEIKTPVQFRAPIEPLSADDMYETIARLVNKSASSRRGQLAPEHSGVLAIGAFHLGQVTLDELCAARQRVLNRQKNRKHHLAGLTFSELSYILVDVTDAFGRPQKQIISSLQTRLVPHPGYTGELIVREGAPPWEDWAVPDPGTS
jgi:hypothetical protein